MVRARLSNVPRIVTSALPRGSRDLWHGCSRGQETVAATSRISSSISPVRARVHDKYLRYSLPAATRNRTGVKHRVSQSNLLAIESMNFRDLGRATKFVAKLTTLPLAKLTTLPLAKLTTFALLARKNGVRFSRIMDVSDVCE